MFKFSFGGLEADGDGDPPGHDAPSSYGGDARRHRDLQAAELLPLALADSLEGARGCSEATVGGMTVLKVTAAEAQDVDIVPGEYEGGRKVWEGSVDLVEDLRQRFPRAEGVTVLELGCGHGFPGLYMLQAGADRVYFSDYNADVLRSITAPTVAANAEAAFGKAVFLSGDWDSASAGPLKGLEVDVILAAETLYTNATVAKVVRMLKAHLKRDGVAVLSNKRYYFGTGGGSLAFVEAAEAAGLSVERAGEVQDGNSNIRDVLLARHGGRG